MASSFRLQVQDLAESQSNDVLQPSSYFVKQTNQRVHLRTLFCNAKNLLHLYLAVSFVRVDVFSVCLTNLVALQRDFETETFAKEKSQCSFTRSSGRCAVSLFFFLIIGFDLSKIVINVVLVEKVPIFSPSKERLDVLLV